MKLRVLATLVAMALLSTAVLADDGMWMPQQIPALGEQLKKLGLQIDPNQFADLTGFPMGAIVSLGGCSASFVSPQGLLVTNHHCVFGALQFNATKENDIITNGFLAKTMKDEIQASPDQKVLVTTNIEDVTKQILAPFPKNTTDRDRATLIARRRRQMVDACETPGVSCQVASFFGGAQYLKITRMEIRDVRLVYAPALGVGNFGDEVDNWMWPRHTGDFGFYRAYVGKDGKPADFSADNVPYQPKHFLKVSTRDLDEGDLVMVVGFPGVTHRHDTALEVQNALEFELPMSVKYRTMLTRLLQERGASDRTIALKNANRIAGLENYMKKHTGSLEAFKRGHYLEAKRKQEAGLRAALPPEMAASYDKARAELESVLEEEYRTQQRDNVFVWLYQASPMLTQANRLVRLSQEKAKADLDRDELYRDRNRRNLEQTVARARRSFEPGSDRAGLRLFLLEAAALPSDQRIPPIDAALAATGKATTPEQIDALLDRIYGSTKIGDKDAETQMMTETTAQLTARKDSMLDFAASLRPFAEQLDAAEKTRTGAMSRLRPVLLDALRVTRGGNLYPDANGTLRVQFGTVKGYSPRNAVWLEAQTDVRGVLEKTTGEIPFVSPQTLLDRAARKEFGPYADPERRSLPVAFLSTNIVTNGSSGSATLNAWGEVCGLAFDSNWEGVGADYLVEEDIARTISVDSRYMLWIMDAVDGADNLLREMGVEPAL
jgi:hypothetical protein